MDLGDQRPSQLLRRMRDLAREKISDETLRVLWQGHLPVSRRAIISVSETKDLDNLALVADKVMETTAFTQVAEVNTPVSSTSSSADTSSMLLAEHFKEFGIYPIVNLPGVGKNLQDHVTMGGHSFLFDNPYTNGTDYCFNLNTAMSIGTLIDFALNKKGPMYSMMEAEAMAFVNTKYQDAYDDYPDSQLFIAPTTDNMDGGLFGKRANGLTDKAYAELYEEMLYESSFSIVPLLLRPRSRGYLKLRDANPYSPPL